MGVLKIKLEFDLPEKQYKNLKVIFEMFNQDINESLEKIAIKFIESSIPDLTNISESKHPRPPIPAIKIVDFCSISCFFSPQNAICREKINLHLLAETYLPHPQFSL